MGDAEMEAKDNYMKFDWKDQRWQVYYRDLYPPPKNTTILTKYKKKWYKNNVDDKLDLDWDPATYSPIKPKPRCPDVEFRDFSRQTAGTGYDRGVMISPADAAFLCISHMVILLTGIVTHTIFRQQSYMFYAGEICVCIMDIAVHFGFKFDRSFISKLFADESGRLMYMTLAYYGLRNIPILSTAILIPVGGTNLLAMGQLAKQRLPIIPEYIRLRLAPYGETPNKHPIMQLRAMAEMQICFVVTLLYIMTFGGFRVGNDISFVLVVLLMHMLFAGFKIDAFTQAAFRTVDRSILSVTGSAKLSTTRRSWSSVEA
eukprot:GEMP01064748.1.p1 GENE.GEMP01064748.1~~GEMP01064748.1.p1  ORF type:complete len:335 (+),score=27.27 GEMP01064748.1:62-1006(+)